MISLTPVLNDSITTPLYIQLYTYIKEAILRDDIMPGDKLPSLRELSKTLSLSLTTVELAYNQLIVEGYINSRPQSGYYVNSIAFETKKVSAAADHSFENLLPQPVSADVNHGRDLYYDPSSFNFAKWKKCANKIFNEYSHLLMEEGNPRGEPPLRHEISKYIYQARGVRCNWEQVVIGAGTQQLINLLCIILHRMSIEHVTFENPGYLPVRGIFKDREFKITGVPVDKDGIQIEKLPTNIKSTVYVSPSNQFPTGSVMSVARRYALLDWAFQNDSIIIEDDYNSELRYYGRPVPSLQGLDDKGQVVYLGSFSSTLFSSIKISYMVLPAPMHELFEEVLKGYTQTCSKAEQLTLSLYMEKGYYQTNLKKLRKLYTQKIVLATSVINKYGRDLIKILNNSSGLHMLLQLNGHASEKSTDKICTAARNAGLIVSPVYNYHDDEESSVIIFYYTRIPIENMEQAVITLINIIAE